MIMMRTSDHNDMMMMMMIMMKIQQVIVETFPLRLADDSWHRLAVVVSGDQIEVRIVITTITTTITTTTISISIIVQYLRVFLVFQNLTIFLYRHQYFTIESFAVVSLFLSV